MFCLSKIRNWTTERSTKLSTTSMFRLSIAWFGLVAVIIFRRQNVAIFNLWSLNWTFSFCASIATIRQYPKTKWITSALRMKRLHIQRAKSKIFSVKPKTFIDFPMKIRRERVDCCLSLSTNNILPPGLMKSLYLYSVAVLNQPCDLKPYNVFVYMVTVSLYFSFSTHSRKASSVLMQKWTSIREK